MNIEHEIHREDEGFTLIELMVVVLIIAILLAIAIPTFLGARGQANSRAAQSSLRNALAAEQTFYTNQQAFGTTASTPTISSIEPNLAWQASGTYVASSPNSITVTLGYVTTAGDTVLLQTEGKDGNCYSVYQTNGTVNATLSGAGTGYNITAGACTGTVGGLTALSSSTQAAAPAIATGSAAGNTGSTGTDASFYATW